MREVEKDIWDRGVQRVKTVKMLSSLMMQSSSVL